MSQELLGQAIALLTGKHWPLIPATGNGKVPCVKWKRFQQQCPTPDELRAWERVHKPTGWAVVTGTVAGIIVVDFDGDTGVEWLKTWGLCPHVRTGSGGLHVYVLHPGWAVPTLNARASKNTWKWPGVDVRGDGGFAMLLGRNGKGPYTQLRELVPDPFDALPAELRDFLRNHASEVAPPKPVANVPLPRIANRVEAHRLGGMALDVAAASGRNNAGFWFACQLRDNGYSQSEASNVMRAYIGRAGSTNIKGLREPYTELEAFASLKEAYSKPPRAPWGEGLQSCPKSARPTSAPPTPTRERSEPAQPLPNADEVGSLNLYVVHMGEPLVGHTGEPLSDNRFSKIPRSVSSDRRLNARDKSVYGALAGFCFQGSVAKVGKRLLSRLAGCAERLVIDSLKKLEITGHIQKAPDRRRGQRAWYILTSPVFGQKQRAGVDEVAIIPGGQPRLVSVKKDQKTAWPSSRRPQPAPPTRSARTKSR